ncbi:MAG: hypothetical protein Fur0027_02990 [Raineya sp.]
MKHLLLTFICSVSIVFTAWAQKPFSYETEFYAIEKNYEKGQYKKALRRLKKKTKSREKSTQTLAYLLQAKVYEAQGLLKDMESSLEKTFQSAQELQANPQIYAVYLSKLADFYQNYGNPAKSLAILENKENEQIIANKASTFVQTEWLAQKAKANLAAGVFQEAERLLGKAILHYDSLLLSKKISRAEKKTARKQKARLLTQRALLETKRGYYDKADSLLRAFQKPVRKLTSVVDIAYIEHLIAFAENREAQEQFRTANQYYKMGQRANEYYDFAFHKTSKGYFRLQEGIVRNNIRNTTSIFGYGLAMLKLKKETKRYFPKNSIYQAKIDLLEVERLLQKRNYAKSLQKLLALLDNASSIYLPADHEVRAIASKYLAQVYAKTASITSQQVEKAYQDWLAIQASRYPKNGLYYQLSQLELANYYVTESEDYQKGKTLFENISLKQLSENISTANPTYIKAGNWFFNYYQSIDDYKNALQVAENNVILAKKNYGYDHVLYAQQLEQLATAFAINGDYRRAEENISQALGILKKQYAQEAERSPLFAEALVKMGAIQGTIANFNKADSLLRNAEVIFANYEKISQKNNKAKEEAFNIEVIKAEAIEETARQFVRIGNYAETEKLLLQILKEREEKFGKESRRLIKPLLELSNLYLTKMDYAQADAYLNRSIQITERTYGRNSFLYAQNLEILARLQNSLSDVEGAKQSIAQAIEVISRIFSPQHIQNAPFLMSLSVIELAENSKKNFKNVEKKLLEALSIVANTFDQKHPQYAEILQTMAGLYLEVGKSEQALEYLAQAEKIWLDKFGNTNNLNIAKIAFLKGEAQIQQGKFAEAERSFIQAQNEYTKIFGEQYEGVVRAISKLGRIYFIQKNYEKANQALLKSTQNYLSYIQKNFSFMSEKQKARYWFAVQSDFEFFKNLVLAQRNTKPELVAELYDQLLFTKGLLLNNSLKIREKILNSNNPILLETYKDLLTKKELYITTLEMSVEERKKINLSNLETEIANLEKKLSIETEKIGLTIDSKPISWKDIKSSLQEGEVVLEFTKVKYYDKNFTDSTLYLVLKIDKNSSYPEIALLPEGNLLEKEMYHFFRNSTIFNKAENTESYNAFWKPFEHLTQKAKRIYWVADGVFTQINPELLYDGNAFLIDKYDICFLSSSKDLLKPTTTSKYNQKVTLVANPEFYLKSKNRGGAVSYLPGTLTEAQNISQLLQTKNWKNNILLAENASEVQIKKLQSDADILHFATHGFFLEDASLSEGISDEMSEIKALNNPMMRSGILLAGAGDLLESQSLLGDGVLTAYEMANLDLSNTKIVVLSACETAKGEVSAGEGVFGLQRSLIVAGAKNIVMSLFKVDDAATADLMTEFYKSYLENSQNPQIAFKNAKKTIREKYKKPIYWGAFIFLGK